jgi:hypothetical protein
MKDYKGKNTSICGLFLGFSCCLTGILADRLNVSLRQDKDVLRFSNHSQFVILMPLGFGHRVAFGSRFPILLNERSPDLPGSLDEHQDNRDIVDAPSVVVVSRGS